jgi:hypothetical protein
MPKTRTSGQGRPRGTPNKATADIKAIAQPYGPAAIALLAELSGLAPGTRAEPDAVRVAALRELLDRGFGKATQPLSGDADSPPLHIEFTWGDAIAQPSTEQVEEDAASGFLVTFATEQPC